ncbi:MAG: alkaline phosphatase family protein [Deltaproteobacteria bacterium]|nr:alkaline phosphatase family protein [Deltaproteobacteria bacterium]
MSGESITGALATVSAYRDTVRYRVSAPGYVTQTLYALRGPSAPREYYLVPIDADRIRARAWTQPDAPRLIQLQFDGMTSAVFERLLAEGQLPAFRALLDRGTHSMFASCCGLLSAPVWTTINTGLGPEEHGIDDFLKQNPITGEASEVTAADIRAPRLWDMAQSQGLRTMVSSVLFPDEGVADPVDDARAGDATRAVRVFRDEIRARRPDLVVFYDTVADSKGHQWWKAYEPEIFRRRNWPLNPESIAFHAEEIPQAYRELDMWTAAALAVSGPQTVIMVLSDHGHEAAPGLSPLRVEPAVFEEIAAGFGAGISACPSMGALELALCADPAVDASAAADTLAQARLPGRRPLFVKVRHRGEPGYDSGGVDARAVRVWLNARDLAHAFDVGGNVTIAGRNIPLPDFF